ncbi:MAG TPA: ABC transporter ATP-binding protein [bacterium]|nr:ABC transporter ATP-binding protein [bacterium]HPQ66171.1 ABC transporter ATP-binding protein [bacterium]
MKSYLKLLKLARRYIFFLIVAAVLSSLISSTMGVSFTAILPFWSKIVEGDPFIPQVSIELPAFLQTAIDSFAAWVNNLPNQKLLYYLIYFVVGISVIRGGLTFLADITLQFVGNSVVRNTRSRIYSHLQSLSLDYFTEQRTGELMARITYDADLLHRGISEGFIRLMQNACDLVLYAGLPIIINWQLALLVFGIFLFLMPPILIIGNVIRKLSSHSQEKIADISSLLQETISGIRVVKAFSMEDYEVKRFERSNKRFYRLMMGMARLDAMVSPVTEVVVIVAMAVVLAVMGNAILDREIDAAQFVIYLACLGSIPRPIKQLGRANNMIQRSAAAMDRIENILRIESSVSEKPDAIEVPPIQESVVFENVGFSYTGKEPVLEGIDLRVRKGEVIAIVGSSGSGKSTLVNLIPRFYDPTAGRIMLDGVDLRDATIRSLRAQMGIVTQEVILFNETVAGNIAYGKKATDREQIAAAARTANAHDFIMKLPHQYDTEVGERGYALSGGERQRISIARAILKDPPILILDEATSALDAESEKLVQEALNRLMVDRTVFVIAHRLSTVRGADRIVVLEDRRIVQVGRHDQLLASGGPYSRLYELQFSR